ncbi:type VI secretion system protein TssA [Motiliproteus sp. MSK22-1]|uniref:type VI secretion system protein TssA n=1 Tax=Motiliproteus sp. MSK22-1 TaxID=1897630 RepID=UPI0009758B17|nr:type VI secretion system protein TssA [Motiliproteus sp. MSK22-1]OMH38673.1 hypothetical protein BGP75_06430 [Motiliproteus sp. MSK22-1]
MSAIDVEALTQEISPESPCGDDLEYDPDFGELERTAQRKEEQQIGDMVVDAEEPDWKSVKKQASALLSRAKDIRIILYLQRASLAVDGLEGFRDGLRLLQELLESHWDSIHPQLDEDDGDPTMRINALVSLCDDSATLRPLRLTPLVNSRTFGSFSYRDLAIESGELPKPEDGNSADSAAINAAFMDADPEELQTTFTAASESLEHIRAIDAYITDQVGAGDAPSFSELQGLLHSIKQSLSARLSDLGVSESTDDATEADTETAATNSQGGQQASLSGQITSREDVIRALDKIIEYYDRSEPASPIPILMVRAKKLVPMGFIDIIKNIAPDGLSEVERIRGPEEDDDD